MTVKVTDYLILKVPRETSKKRCTKLVFVKFKVHKHVDCNKENGRTACLVVTTTGRENKLNRAVRHLTVGHRLRFDKKWECIRTLTTHVGREMRPVTVKS